MRERRDWQKLLGLAIAMALLGWYYDYLSVETRTWLLPLAIFAAAAFMIARFKQLEYETRTRRLAAYRVEAQELSIIDEKGNERIAISSQSENPLVAIYDETHVPRITLEISHRHPVLKLFGEKASVVLEFNEEGIPNLTFRGERQESLWSAP